MTTIHPHRFAKTVSEDRTYGFDFSKAPEVWHNGTLQSAVVSGTIVGGSGLSFGTPSTLPSGMDDIPANAGLSCRIYGGTAGMTYKFAALATLANGRVLVIPCEMTVTTDDLS